LNSSLHKIFAAAILLIAMSAFAEIDHGLYDSVLKSHTKDGQVDYPAVAADKSYATYLEQLAATPAPSAKNDKLVYYMNAYNALAMKGIIDGRSPSNFLGRHIFFKSTKFKLAGSETNLHNIEHEILRKLGEPRIHFAIVCASTSCPKIRSDAFTAAKLEEQLDDNARRFTVSTKRKRSLICRKSSNGSPRILMRVLAPCRNLSRNMRAIPMSRKSWLRTATRSNSWITVGI
jgi:Protein of unknown function, DUF547